MTECGCGWPLSAHGCTACDLANQRRRAGRCIDCGSPDRAFGVYCKKCFEGWMELYGDMEDRQEHADA